MANLQHGLPPDKAKVLKEWIALELAKEAQGIEAAEAAKTTQIGLAEGESPVGDADAPNIEGNQRNVR